MHRRRAFLTVLSGGMPEINMTCPAITPTLGTELVSNGNMETGDPPTGWAASRANLDGVADERTGGAGAQSLSIANTDTYGKATQALTHAANVWVLGSGWGRRVGLDAQPNLRFITAPNVNIPFSNTTTWGSASGTLRMTAANVAVWCVNNTTGLVEGRFDDISVKPMTFSTMISLLGSRSAQNGTYLCHPTAAARTQCGILLEYKDATNFVMAIVDQVTATAKLKSCIAGTYTIAREGAITYSAAGELKVVVSGTTHQLFYKSVQVGADVTIDNSGLGKAVYGFNTFAGNTVGVVTTSP